MEPASTWSEIGANETRIYEAKPYTSKTPDYKELIATNKVEQSASNVNSKAHIKPLPWPEFDHLRRNSAGLVG